MRVKRGLAAHRRHKKYLDMAKGFRGGRSRLYRTAREAVERSLAYAFVGRKQRKREFRKLWILRINAGARENGLSYSKLMFGLAQAGVALNRKVLADLAVRQKEDFAQVGRTGQDEARLRRVSGRTKQGSKAEDSSFALQYKARCDGSFTGTILIDTTRVGLGMSSALFSCVLKKVFWGSEGLVLER